MDAFVNKWNGKQVTAYGGECVALVAQYLVEQGRPIAYANAKDWWGHPAIAGSYDFITNNPNDYNQVPQRGDVIVWNGGLAGSGGYGHIAIYDAKVSPGVFRSFDQNWGGRQAHFVNHTYNNVIGWFRPKGSAPSGGDEMIGSIEEADRQYKMLRPNGGGTPAELSATAGKRTYKQFGIDAVPEVNVRNQALANQNAQLGNMQNSINQLNQTLTAITQARDAAVAEGSKTKAELVEIMAQEQAQLAELAKLTSELETAHDTIKDLQAEAKPVDEQVVVTNWLKRIWNNLFKKG